MGSVAKMEDETERAKRLSEIFSTLVNGLLLVAKYLSPFLPETAQKMYDTFAHDELPGEMPIMFPKKYLHTQEPERK